MSVQIVLCAGKNGSARRKTANSLQSQMGGKAKVIEAKSAASLEAQLEPYTHQQLRVMLQYFIVPDKAILSNPGEWWDGVSGVIGRSAPEISRNASAKANINQDTGGGFLQFCWEDISAGDLKEFCQILDNTLPGENQPAKQWWQFWK
ncbi:MAG TPA: hypothetical protein VE263_01250 [Candidatus Angelobacter sp.]|nr:hypothetical protein [Candidatus Angelobacter sp.]